MQHRPAPSLPPVSTLIHSIRTESRRILVAGGDPRMRIAVTSLLRQDGYTVAQSADDPELLDHIACSLSSPPWHEPIGAVILDARDEWSSLELLSKLRARDWATPVVVLIARGDLETMEEARRLGASLVLPLPIAPDDLRDALLAVMPL